MSRGFENVVSSSLKLFCASYFWKAHQADEVHGPFRRLQLHLRYPQSFLDFLQNCSEIWAQMREIEAKGIQCLMQELLRLRHKKTTHMNTHHKPIICPWNFHIYNPAFPRMELDHLAIAGIDCFACAAACLACDATASASLWIFSDLTLRR